VRSLTKLVAAASFAFLVIFFLDRNFQLLPNAVHEYMPQHHHGLVVTDITITKCNKVNIFSSCKLDPEIWHRIDKNLYLGNTWVSSAYVHIQRKKEEDLAPDDKVVIDVKVGSIDPSDGAQVQPQARWESRAAGLWILRSAKPHASDSKDAVTAVDVLFGDDAYEVRPGWEMRGTALRLGGDRDMTSAHITFRRGSQDKFPHQPSPRIKPNGKFKIMQLADLHLSTGVGRCRDAIPDEYEGGPCEADPRTLDFVAKLLEDERPDLVVLSGDQVNGGTAPDVQTVGTIDLYNARGISCSQRLAYRLFLSMRTCSLNTRYPTCRYLAIMTTRAPCHVLHRWPSLSNFHIHYRVLDPTTLTEWATTVLKSLLKESRHTRR